MQSPYKNLVDDGFEYIGQINGYMGNEPTTLFRYQRSGYDEVNLRSEHVSFIVNGKNVLKGLVRMKSGLFSSASNLPKKEDAKLIAKKFLEIYAADLLDDMTIQWVDVHSEVVDTNDGPVTLNGMKVKCRKPSDGLYFWVIVASDNSVMAFERDIKWDFFRSGRKTEKWLHDNWLLENSKKFKINNRVEALTKLD